MFQTQILKKLRMKYIKLSSFFFFLNSQYVAVETCYKLSPELSAVHSLQLKFKCIKNPVSFKYILITHRIHFIGLLHPLYTSHLRLLKFQVNITKPKLKVMFFVSI